MPRTRTPVPSAARVAAAAPAYAANSDAPFFDLFAALRVLRRIHDLPLDRLEVLLDRIEAQPKPVDALTVRELVALVQGVQP